VKKARVLYHRGPNRDSAIAIMLFVRPLRHHGALRLLQILRPPVTFGLRWRIPPVDAKTSWASSLPSRSLVPIERKARIETLCQGGIALLRRQFDRLPL
jgi:hypothetical protein